MRPGTAKQQFITKHMLQLPHPAAGHPVLGGDLRQRLVYGIVIGVCAVILIVGSIAVGATGLGVAVIGGSLAIIISAWIIVQPQVGVYILVIFVYLNLSDVLEVSFHIPSINKVLVALILVSVLVNRLIQQRRPMTFGRIELLILIYGLVTLVSILPADDRSTGLIILSNWVKDFTILIIVVQLCDKEHHWKTMQWLMILSASFLGSLSCYQMLSHNFDNTFYGLANAPVNLITTGFDSQRVSGPLSDPNYYGQILLTALPIAVYRLLAEDDRLKRIIGGVCTLLITAAMIFTYSRGSFVAVVVVGILIARERKFSLVKLTIGFTALLLILTPILPAGYLDRILTLQDVLPSDLSAQTDPAFRGRSSEMIVAMQMFIDHPIIGLGLANYESHYLEYSALVGLDNRFEPREAHDLYLEIAAETGILGLLTFLGMLVAVISSLWRAKRRLARIKRTDLMPWVSGVEYGLASYLVTSIFLHGSYIRYFWLIIALAVGCAVLVDTLTTQSQQASQTQIEEPRGSPVRTPDNETRVAST